MTRTVLYRHGEAWTPVELPTGEIIEVQVEGRPGYVVCLVGIRVLEGDAIDSALLRRVPIGRITRELTGQRGVMMARRLRLAPLSTMSRRTPAQREAFYQSIATNYLDAAAQSYRPCADIAEGLGISPRTVQGWVLEARRRGHLPPGRPGKADIEEARRVAVRR